MLKFFLRFYIGVTFALLVSLSVVAIIFDNQYKLAVAEDHIRMTKAVNHMLTLDLQAQPSEKWPVIITDAQAEQPFEINIVNLTELPLSQQQQIQSTGLLVQVESGLVRDEVTVFYPLLNTDKAITYTPKINLNVQYNYIALAIIIMLLIGFAVAVYLLARPIIRHVNQLIDTSLAIGSGKLRSRADESAPVPLNRLAIAINQMAAQLEELVSGQEIMTGAASHELRTPISRLRFAVDMTETIDEQRQLKAHVAEMSGDIDNLESLVNELLTYSKFRNHQTELEIQRLRLNPILQRLRSELQPLQPATNIQLECPADLYVLACQSSLSRAVSNLIRNAQHYGNSKILLQAKQLQMGETSITVEDDGPGIPEESHSVVTQPFYRIDVSRCRETGGFGLGLAIVHRIITLHNGAFSIGKSRFGGAAITLRLPG